MDIVLTPSRLSGTVNATPSKSQAHRLLICAALADRPTNVICPETSLDIEATVSCLNAIGADIQSTPTGYLVTPITSTPTNAFLNCHESGATLRFMLPIIGALGIDATFLLSGRLPHRPISPLWDEMGRMGCQLSRLDRATIHCTGKLRPGNYSIAGNISSQFVSGLLLAMTLIPGTSYLEVTGEIESLPYIEMTRHALSSFGVSTEGYAVTGGYPLTSPGSIIIEGDWSNAAFFVAANAMGHSIELKNLNPKSVQGDKQIVVLAENLKRHCSISAADIPDLIPILSVLAAVNQGAEFTQIQRLRSKESDRVASIEAMLSSLGIRTESDANTLKIFPGEIRSGVVDSFNDHRIAMSAAIAATVANGPLTVLNADCVNKSYPGFWHTYQRLGGQYEQLIR